MKSLYSILLLVFGLFTFVLSQKDENKLNITSKADVQQNINAQRTTIYEQFNGVGSFLTTPNYEEHLGSKGWDNRARSICVTGVWLAYDLPNYNQGYDAAMEYFYGANNNCFNFNAIAGRATSLRFAGSPSNHQQDTITFYETTYFQGAEEYLLSDAQFLNLDGKIKSIIVTGVSRWTVYDQASYRGNSLCIITPGNYDPTFITDTVKIGAPWGTIKSVRKGCLSANEVKPEAAGTKIASYIPHGIHQVAKPVPEDGDVNNDLQFII